MPPASTAATSSRRHPELFVVDGSNIATEGRSVPSLEQLNEAVLGFLEAHPGAVVTVVVDATFGHRIAKHEVKAFDEAVANNELVTPPAGAVGRGDAFVLAIADKAGAGILSNDSFQEFHGDYEWLFDDGRLIGGKPVPHVGWVFVKRSPVRGPKSRQAVRAANGDVTAAKQRANRRVRKKDADELVDESVEGASNPEDAAVEAAVERAAAAPVAAKGPVNDLVPFLEFVQRHPIGTSCSAVVESYSSHGAYARAGDVLVYVPLRLMDDPTPRSARSALGLGEAITAVIVGYVPDRRSIDAALPHMADRALAAVGAPEEATSGSSPARKSPARKSPARKSPSRKSPASDSDGSAGVERLSAETTGTKSTAKGAAAKQPAVAKKAAAKKTAAKKTVAEKTVAKRTVAKRTVAKKPAVEQTAAKQTAVKKTVAKKAVAKTAAKKTAAKKTAAKKTAAKKAPAASTRKGTAS